MNKLINYKEFQNEFSINESAIVFDDKLIDLLDSIDSPIAKELLSIESSGDDLKVTSNFFSKGPDNDTIEFTPDKKAQKIVSDGENVWDQLRQTIKIGRGVRAILKAADKKFTDSEIEEFVNKWKSAYEISNNIFAKFEIVSGSDIETWYNYENYALEDTKGTLSNSCMSKVPSSYFEIYVKNPDQCQLVILKDTDDKIRGRAILWYVSPSHNDGEKGMYIMDRIYTHFDSDGVLFRKYCMDCGKKSVARGDDPWYYKYYNDSSDNGYFVDSDEKNHYFDITITLDTRKCDKYPYLDTLKYYNPDNGLISNSKHSNCIILEDTGGGYDNGECEECSGRGEVDCDSCNGSGVCECFECDGSGETECQNCNNGHIDCDECDGGEVDCDECNGSGEVDDEECEKCNGSGKDKCEECKGEGNIDCLDCDGKSHVECTSCSGDGEYECNECSGEGRTTCTSCGGDGYRDY